ncbi:hypothetical protein [Pseudomonas syringae]|uniref:Uncharacterized protein n=4 Tax=Pseudomonas syringae group TaxID=136849 RepID=A0A656JJM2_PSESF|nr:hypothetical protein [Pseudomonas syringae]EPN31521.1 hypothetical protein A245_44760 [Pseudomonas syringae pv. actinidiae ICMP 19096]OZI86867.1 hypothetical protein CFN58_08030 [Pseudomonas avellanae]AQL35329.1 hypothetical protein JN853_01720 [Pseudomonas syringae pv. actinidiae ICMP 9853]ATV20448.1 hypothetical protein CT122_29505 [Pseudomonas syringae pv. actinidiae]EPM50390.1 hypothetical protein A246_05484 [Pseudomonas syringae pv. actinidiae ICMP 19098]
MVTRTQLNNLAKQAPQDHRFWAAFVAHTEFLWQDTALIPDGVAWQRQWFELEILNALALAEWEEQGRADDWTAPWRATYQQDAIQLTTELLELVASNEANLDW